MEKLREEEVEEVMDEDEMVIDAFLQLSQASPQRVEKLSPEEEEAIHGCALGLLKLGQDKTQFIWKKEEDTSQFEKVKTKGQTVKKQVKNRSPVVEDDSPQTLNLLRDWINNTAPKNPPQEIIDIVGVCSKPIRKQLTVTDLNIDQTRLMLGKEQVKKMMLAVIKKSDVLSKKGLEVPVYGNDGKEIEMRFAMWTKLKDTPVLTGKGWNQFVKDYRFKKHSDFVSVWMFRHKLTHKICFAIDFTRFDQITQRLSKRILKNVFNNSS